MTTIKLKNGSGAPAGGDLVQGEPALDLTNKRLYTEDSGGNVIEVGTNPGASGAVTLNHSGSTKLATTSTGIDVTGSITTDGLTSVGGSISIGADGAGDDFRFYGDTSGRYMEWVSSADSLLFRDGAKALFGNGSDLQIYHDGSNSYIKDAGTGDLIIQASDDLKLQTASGTNMAVFTENTYARFFYNGTARFETTNTGIDVTGTVTADSATIGSDGAVYDLTLESNAPILRLSDTSASTAHSLVSNNAELRVQGDSLLSLRTDNKKRLDIGSGGDISFYEDTGTTPKLFWDASAERLSLGTSSPARQLHIQSNGPDAYLKLNSTGNNSSALLELANDATTWTAGVNSTDTFVINNGANERMRIDSSGNLLVGTTSAAVANGTTAGIAATPSNQLLVGTSSDVSAAFNRITNDGDIVLFRKDGTTVGSIGTVGSDLYVGSGGAGVRFYEADNSIIPCSDAGVASNGAIDIGDGSFRFKDLHLAGDVIAPNIVASNGVFLGGTGSANKLDDYEYGTFTPVVSVGVTSPVYASQGGSYVKIGKLVTFQLRLELSGGTANASHFKIGGLPFTSSNQSNYGGAFFNYSDGFITDIGARTMHIGANGTLISFYKTDGGQLAGTDVDDLTSTLLINGQYEVA